MLGFHLVFVAFSLGCLACSGQSAEPPKPACGKQGESCCEAKTCAQDLSCDASQLCVAAHPRGLGQACVTTGDCRKGYCESLDDRKRCNQSCTASVGCGLSGWVCDEAKRSCSCEPSVEVCNGADDDCNGIIDDPEVVATACEEQVTGSSCKLGECACPVARCGSACVDTQTDPLYCGACATSCQSSEVCVAGACEKPSCKGGLRCNDESCCKSLPVTGGTFPMGRSESGTDAYPTAGFNYDLPEHPVTVSAFELDKYEVTVGRMRNFVESYDAWRSAGHPKAGEGAHSLITGSGWNVSWQLPDSADALRESLKCSSYLQTWTDKPGIRENQPIHCISWELAFAFCAWDGGRLPTEAEWEYAAAGGSENRLYPWGSSSLPIDSCAGRAVCECTTDPPTCVADDFLTVGSHQLGNGRFGHCDLAGSVSEWVLDGYDAGWYAGEGNGCKDCALLDWSGGRISRSSALGSRESVRSANREVYTGALMLGGLGIRCARPAR